MAPQTERSAAPAIHNIERYILNCLILKEQEEGVVFSSYSETAPTHAPDNLLRTLVTNTTRFLTYVFTSTAMPKFVSAFNKQL